jgi:hypothetical protein
MIGTLRESSLHAALKQWYAHPDDALEVAVDGYVVDIRRGDLLIEIQTHNFSALKRKLPRLLEGHAVRLVHPIALKKWIVRVEADHDTRISRRQSPRQGRLEHLFLELVSIPELVAHPNFSLEVLLIHEDEIRCPGLSGRRTRWRPRVWRTCNRRLLDVVDRVVLATPADFRTFLPAGLPQPFTSRELAGALDQPDYLAQKITYCLRKMGAIQPAGKRGNTLLYVDDASKGHKERP